MNEQEAIEFAVKRIFEAMNKARKDGEYANGYNSGAWAGGRSEGFALAIDAVRGTLKSGQWSNYK